MTEADKPDLRYTPFIAHYTDADGNQVPRHFASNAEAHAFRASLVEGKLPAEPVKVEEPKTEDKVGSDPTKAGIKAADKPEPPVLTGMKATETPEPKTDANPPVAAAGRP